MSWSKGAVVIVKRGDQEWGDVIEDALDVKRASNKELEELRKENEELKRDKELARNHDTRFTNKAIQDLKDENEHYKTPPKWLRVIKEGFAFIVYWISVFWDKYLTIK